MVKYTHTFARSAVPVLSLLSAPLFFVPLIAGLTRRRNFLPPICRQLAIRQDPGHPSKPAFSDDRVTFIYLTRGQGDAWTNG
jgi:hypothetical protein